MTERREWEKALQRKFEAVTNEHVKEMKKEEDKIGGQEKERTKTNEKRGRGDFFSRYREPIVATSQGSGVIDENSRVCKQHTHLWSTL